MAFSHHSYTDDSFLQHLLSVISSLPLRTLWTARNLDVTQDVPLSVTANIFVINCSCRFVLHNIRGILLFLTQEAARVLVQALVILSLDYCNLPPAGVPPYAIWPVQFIQNSFNWSSMYPSSPTPRHSSASCHGCSNRIQDNGTCLPCCEWLRPLLYPSMVKPHIPCPVQYAVLSISWVNAFNSTS